MAKNILSKESYTLKLSKEDSKNLARFCMISPPIFDAVSSMLTQIKLVEAYIREWKELEKPISNIIRKIQ